MSEVTSAAEVLSLDECVRLISGTGGLHTAIPWLYAGKPTPTRSVARLGIPPLRFADGPKGVGLGRSTCFPVPIARGASWDDALEYEIGAAMGAEAAAQGANALGAVCVNVIRHPGWGRAQESFSADPLLLGALGSALVRGIQSRNVLAVVKHYACNSIEKSRFRVDVRVDERALHEVYLPHFRACVEAGAACVMSAYNRVNGEYCGQNPALLRDILRERWGFSGFVMSDFFLGTRSTTRALRSGLDLEMPRTWFFSRRRIRRALRAGRLDEDTVRTACKRIVGQLERFGHVGGGPCGPDRSVAACGTHRDLALACARRSIVLLDNDGTLPLAGIRSLAVIGDRAREANLGSEGSISVRPPFAIDPLQGLQNELDGVRIHYDPGRDPERAAALAADCDAAVVAGGLRGRDEGEYFPLLAGGDRRRLELPDRQIRLIEAVAAANDRTAVVLFGGSAIACGDWRHRVGALLMAWYPGMMGGRALAEILSGRVDPSGRLPLSLPERTEDLPPFDPDADSVTYDLWHDHRWLDRQGIEPAYAFGHGLSYAPVEYLGAEVSRLRAEIRVAVTLANRGDRDTSEVVQIYLAGDAPGGERASRELKAYCRETVPAGTTAHVAEIRFPVERLAWFDPDGGDWRLEPGRYRLLCGPSARELPLEGTVTIVG